MEAKELRIGNYVYDKNCDEIETITSMWITYQDYWCNTYSLEVGEAKQLKPIPLTEEWILKFGFEKGDDILGDCFYIERQYIDDFVIHHYKNTSFEFFPYDVTVTHVHQLQNLYHALTGEELTFND